MTERKRIRDNERNRDRRAASIAAYITLCDDALQAELERHNGEWPDHVTVPLWPGPVERLAFVHWLDELRGKTGKTIRVEFKTPLFPAARRPAHRHDFTRHCTSTLDDHKIERDTCAASELIRRVVNSF
jgi:hypothetical protein